jgi:hypothetical protein
MPLKAAMWIHGNIVQVEFPERLIDIPEVGKTGFRRGWGTLFQGPRDPRPESLQNWFHFPMPTPVILDDIRPQLVKVFVFYKATFAEITHIHLYDGPIIVRAFDVSLGGDHSTTIDASNSWVIDPPITIFFGLGISVGVMFHPVSIAPNELLFTTAGADFVTP